MAIIITIINIITRGVFRAVGIYKRNNENKKTGTRLKKNNSLKKTRSRQRKRPRKKNFLFFMIVFLVECVFS